MRLKKFNEFKLNEDFSTGLDIDMNIIDVKQEIKDIKRQRNELNRDMEEEAGQKGDKWTDDDANRYGEEFNKLDDKEVELRKNLEKLIQDLEEEEKKEIIENVVDEFKSMIDEVTTVDNFTYEITDKEIVFKVFTGDEEMHFGAYSTGAVYLEELGRKYWLGDVGGKDTKKFLEKIFSLEGDDYKNFLDSFNESDFE